MPRKYPSPGTHCGTGYAARSLVPGRDGGEDAVEDRSQEGRKHIFAINGAPEFLNIVRELFQEEAYNVTTTNYVPNSFDQIAALDPDALIVDIVVGQQVGWELLEQLNAAAATTGIPVLIVSTDPRLLERAQEQAARYGKNRYLIKPFGLDDILAQIREMIGTA
jgi:DNA-binding response OmpR family regulator